MHNSELHSTYGIIGRTTGYAVFILGIAYAFTTILGFLSLQSPEDPIGDPFFTIMELLTILIAPLMATSMVAVHYHAAPEDRIYSLASVCFMFIMAGITSSVHFVILSAGHQMKAAGLEGFQILFSFKWPSVVYALDILAWDWFFAISVLLAAPVFKAGRLEKTLRILMTVCGLVSLVGLMGVPLGNMQVRNIGIIGYGVIAPFIFLLIGIVIRSARPPSVK